MAKGFEWPSSGSALICFWLAVVRRCLNDLENSRGESKPSYTRWTGPCGIFEGDDLLDTGRSLE